MKNPWLKFLNVSIANLLVGAGLGTVAGWCMTAGLELQYQTLFTYDAAVLGAALGLPLGWVMYYGILKRKLTYEAFCAVMAITTAATAAVAYLLHRLTDTGGWLCIFVAIPVFLVASFKLRQSG